MREEGIKKIRSSSPSDCDAINTVYSHLLFIDGRKESEYVVEKLID
jgi:hypothetical protein